MITVNGFQLLTIIKKCSILDVATVLEPSELLCKKDILQNVTNSSAVESFFSRSKNLLQPLISEKCPNMEFFMVLILLIRTRQNFAFVHFYAMHIILNTLLTRKI